MREIFNFNDNWLYYVHNAASDPLFLPIHEIDFDDSAWRKLNVPHDGSIELEFKESNRSGPRGAYASYIMCYYRKHFDGTVFQKDQNIEITFGGIYSKSTVFINGHDLGTYPSGYTTITYDLTKYFNFDGDNVIAVRVNNEIQPSSRWYTGMGIYRDVTLIAKEKMHIDESELIIKTENCTSKIAIANVKFPLVNQSCKRENLEVFCELFTDNGELVEKRVKSLKILEKETRNIDFSFAVENVNLWSSKSPNRYYMKISIINEEKIDELVQWFGFREAKFTPDGFFINGTKERLKGACLHHDNGPLGACALREAFIRKLEIMREMGVNAIRTSHNTEDIGFIDLCDEMGFYVMEEAFDEWTIGKRPSVFGNVRERIPMFAYSLYFNEYAEKDLVAMIKRDRNHPSIIAWSIGNEIEELKHKDWEGLTRRLCEIVHETDETRPSTFAGYGYDQINATENPNIVDLVGYNYAEDSYDIDHKEMPKRIMVGSETSTVTAFESRGIYEQLLDSSENLDKNIEDDPERMSMKELKLANTRERMFKGERSWKGHKENPFVAGNFIWTGIDYLGETTPEIWPSVGSYFAPVDRALFPKDAFYFYQSIWTEKPVLHLFPHWNLSGCEGKKVPVLCYTNCHEVELFVNGISQGKQIFDGFDTFHLEWTVEYQKGEIKAVGLYNGEIIEQIIKTTKEPDYLKVDIDRTKIETGKLAYICVKICDEDGNIVPTAMNHLQIQVDDGMEILGVDNGSATNHTFKGNEIDAWCGLARVIVRGDDVGEKSIKITSENLKSAEIGVKIV